ncbi:replication regulatory protein RepA, partial [Escherichia coli]|uniref:replication regulatory protein RepA n=1 Tax=Escherichia coli TaxID=562 RepID=UPI000E20FB32
MSQTENTVTSSSGAKRAYRKGNPLSDAEKQRLSVARKRASFKEVKVFLEPKYKGTVAKLAMRQPFVLFKGLTFQKLCLP